MLSLIRNGVTYSLDDGTYCYWLGDDGTGMAPMHRLSERGPLQHGDTDRGYRLDPRVLRLILLVAGTSRDNMYAKRQTLEDLFSPDINISLLWALSGGERQIDCYYAGEMDLSSGERDGFSQQAVVTLKANDPTFYSPAPKFATVQIGGG